MTDLGDQILSTSGEWVDREELDQAEGELVATPARLLRALADSLTSYGYEHELREEVAELLAARRKTKRAVAQADGSGD